MKRLTKVTCLICLLAVMTMFGATSSFAAGFLPAPELLTPANGQTGVGVTPVMTWSGVLGATAYHIQIATDTLFKSITAEATTSSTEYSIPEGILSPSTVYYWRAATIDFSKNQGEWSGNFDFRTYSLPSITNNFPVDITAGNDWVKYISGVTNPEDGLSYTNVIFNFQISADSSLTVGDLTIEHYDGLEWVSLPLTQGENILLGSYGPPEGFPLPSGYNDSTSFRIKASSNAPIGTYNTLTVLLDLSTDPDAQLADANGTFNVLMGAPSAPVLLTPADSSTGVSTLPSFDWEDVSGADVYNIQIATDAAFADVIAEANDLVSSDFTLKSALNTGSTYYWRVNSENKGEESEYSSPFSFVTIKPAPPAPVQLLPLNGASDVALNPTFDWAVVKAADVYNLEISLDTSFSTLEIHSKDLDTNSYTLKTSLANNTVYFWRVSSENSGGNSGYSEIFSFTTVVSAPSAPSLLTPENGAKGISFNPTLDWTDAEKDNLLETVYEIELASDTSFSDPIISKVGLASSEYTVSDDTLDPAAQHYWRVRVLNSGGTSPWSATWSFTTTFLTGTGTAGTIPMEYDLHQNYPNPFNPVTKIKFDIPSNNGAVQHAKLVVYNMLGQMVANLIDAQITPGSYEVQWDAAKMSSGIYFYELRTENFRSIKRMTLVK